MRMRKPKTLPKMSLWGKIAICAVSIGLAILLGVTYIYKSAHNEPDRNAIRQIGSILETRLVIDHTADSIHGGRIYYRIEARTRFAAQEQRQERWLLASDITSNRDRLDALLAKHPKECVVSWNPGYPENAQCQILH